MLYLNISFSLKSIFCFRIPITVHYTSRHILGSSELRQLLRFSLVLMILTVLRYTRHVFRTSLMAQMVKRLSTMWETQVQSPGWEDPLEKEMAIHSSTIALKIPWTEEPGRLQSVESQRVRHDWATSVHFTSDTYFIEFSSISDFFFHW